MRVCATAPVSSSSGSTRERRCHGRLGLSVFSRALGLRASVQDASFDLDAIEDLRWLAAARDGAVTHLCSRTLAYLDEHDLWRHALVF